MKPMTTAQFLKANLLYACTLNIAIDKKAKMYEFDAITKYVILEHMKISFADMPLWDLFGDFTTVKNAVACLLYCIENKAGITPEIIKQQSKLTPKREMPKVAGYNEFIALLKPEEKTFLLKIANEWLQDYCNGDTSMDAFFINGTNGVTFKEGDLIIGYDPVYAQATATRVLQANPNGFIQCVDNGGTFTLTKSINPQLTTAERLGTDLTEALKAFDAQQRNALENDRLDVVAKVEKKAEAAKKLAAAEEARKEKAEKAALAKAEADKAKAAEFEALNALILDTPEKIKVAVEKLNLAKLPEEKHNIIHAKLKAAKKAITTTNTTATPTTAASTPKGKAAKATPAPAAKTDTKATTAKNAAIAARLNDEEPTETPAPAAQPARQAPGKRK